jgi:hypothetical protein
MSELQIFDCEQGSPEWYACRLGIPTASEFETVCAQRGPRGGEPKGRRTYMLKLIGERMTGQPKYDYQNDHMVRGKEMEDEARRWYQMVTEITTQKVGFMRRGDAGASPDSLVGNDGMLEIKTKLPHLQLEYLLDDDAWTEHKPQTQGQLWIGEREWCDLVPYWPGLPTRALRIYRDEPYIKQMSIYVDVFNNELLELMARIQQKAAA